MSQANTAVEVEPLFLTPRETREVLGLSNYGLRKMRAKKTGPKFAKLSTRTILYFRVNVNAWKATNQARTTLT